MSELTAKELYNSLKKRRDRKKQDAYLTLKDICKKAITEMVKDLNMVTEVSLDTNMKQAIIDVVEDLRDLGYKTCLVERQDLEGNIKDVRLRISIAYLDKNVQDWV